MFDFNFNRLTPYRKYFSWEGLRRQDLRYPWVKFVLFFAIIATMVLGLGHNSFVDWYQITQRSNTLQHEIDEIRPRLEADSTRLAELKALGKEIEIIARERYLMKAPGEEIFLIRQDSNQLQD